MSGFGGGGRVLTPGGMDFAALAAALVAGDSISLSADAETQTLTVNSTAHGIDAPPASGDARNEEFEGTLNALYTKSKSGTFTEDVNGIIPSCAAGYFTAAGQFFSYAVDYAPEGDFSVTAKVFMQLLMDNAYVGLVAQNTAGTESVTAAAQMNATKRMTMHKTDAGVDSYFITNEVFEQYLSGYVLHLQRVGDVWSFWFSLDGGHTFKATNGFTLSKAFTVNKVLINFSMSLQTAKTMFAVDWMRFNWRMF